MGEEMSSNGTWLTEPTSIALCEGKGLNMGAQVESGPMAMLKDSSHGDSTC